MGKEYEAVPENDGRPTKCTFIDGRLTACWPLDDALEAPYGRGTKHQGAKLISFVNMNELKFSRNAVSLISGKHNRGIQLTFCPFCASILQPSLAEEVIVRLEERETDAARSLSEAGGVAVQKTQSSGNLQRQERATTNNTSSDPEGQVRP